jgi:phospholipase/carboxylesterase
MGFSQGAMTALFTGLRRATPPAALLAYSGALLAPEALTAEIVSRPPVLLVHGEADEVVPVQASRNAEAALRAAGVPVQALYRPGLGHGIDEAGLAAGAALLAKAFSSGSSAGR